MKCASSDDSEEDSEGEVSGVGLALAACIFVGIMCLATLATWGIHVLLSRLLFTPDVRLDLVICGSITGLMTACAITYSLWREPKVYRHEESDLPEDGKKKVTGSAAQART